MRSKILTIALALSLIVVAFAALPAKTTAAVYYTGSVRTTDDVNVTKTTFVELESIYFCLQLFYYGEPASGVGGVNVWVTGGSSFLGLTTSSSGWIVGGPLHVYNFDTPDVKVCDVVATVGGYEFARAQITALNERLTLEPDLDVYYPEQSVDITLVTEHTDDFYVQIVNETYITKENWTSQETGEDRYWNAVWDIPADFADGSYTMNVRHETTHAVWFTEYFDVAKYDLEVMVSRDCVLPKEVVSISYMITNVATGLPYYGPTVEYLAQYFNASVEEVFNDNETNVSGTLPGSSGIFNYTVPSDIALWSNVWFEFWANETGRTSKAKLTLYISLLDASVATNAGTYYPGEPVGVTVTAYAEAVGDTDELEGASVDVKVSLNGTDIPAYGATGLVTGKNGQVTYMFTLAESAPAAVYIVKATVAKLDMTRVVMKAFTVDEECWMTVEFDRDEYIGGDTATLSFRTVLNNMDVSAAISYIVSIESGVLTTGNSSGEDVPVMIPTDYYGWIHVEAGAYIGVNPVDDDDDADVILAKVILIAADDVYRPGDTVVWNWEIRTGLANASLMYWILDDDDVLVDTGALEFALTGAIEFAVPEEGASESYEATLRMTSALGGVVDTSFTVDAVAKYELLIWVEKSKYASGEFKPGNTMTVSYEILSHLAEDLPVYRLRFEFSNDPAEYRILVSEVEGSFEYVIPDDASSGEKTVTANFFTGDGLWLGEPADANYVINNRLSFWDLSVGGMAMSDFLIVVLLVVMIIMLIVMPMAKGWKAKSKSAPAAEEPPPPAEPPKA